MSKKKEPNKGTLPCMVCGKQLNYLNTAHMETHSAEKPQSIPRYREWVADQFDLPDDDPAIQENNLLKPQLWRENQEKFDGWRDMID